jgi:hypothetical protein
VANGVVRRLATARSLWQRIVTASVLALIPLALAACAPSVDSCRGVLPTAAANVRVVQADGRTSCTGEVDEVTVAVDMQRSGLGWQPGAVTVDGSPSSATTLSEDITRARVERKTMRVMGTVQGVARGIERALKPSPPPK